MKQKLKWTEEEDFLLKTNYKKEGIDQCLKLINRTRSSIQCRAARLKIKTKNKNKKGLRNNFSLSKKEVDKIILLMKKEQKSLKDTAKLYNVYTALMSENIKKYYPDINFSEIRRYNNIDHTYFDKIGPNQAYFIGLIYSDGCILKNNKLDNQVSISLHFKDKYILDQFSKELKFKGKVKIYKRKSRSSYKADASPMATLRFWSTQLTDKLRELGIGPKKSLTVKIPDFFLKNDDLFWHFLRGIVDGDGSISNGKSKNGKRKDFQFLITGNIFTCTILASFLKEKYSLGTGKARLKKENTYTFCISGNKQIKKLYYLLYKNADFFLIRKHNRFSECLLQDGLKPLISSEILPEYQNLQPSETVLALETQLS